MTRFISLRAKMYAYEIKGVDKCKMVAKGIPTIVIKNNTNFMDFYNSLFYNKEKNYTFKNFTNKNHQVYTETQTKKGLDPFDDKRYYLNNINSEPYLF